MWRIMVTTSWAPLTVRWGSGDSGLNPAFIHYAVQIGNSMIRELLKYLGTLEKKLDEKASCSMSDMSALNVAYFVLYVRWIP